MSFSLDWREDEVIREADKVFTEVEEQAAERIAADAKALCPVGTVSRTGKYPWQRREPGTLRDSIRAVPSRYEGGGYIVLAGGYYAYYAPYVELGTKKMSAQSFLKPALHKNERATLARYKRAAK